MNALPFDLDLLIAFATVVDCWGFRATASRLHSTWSSARRWWVPEARC